MIKVFTILPFHKPDFLLIAIINQQVPHGSDLGITPPWYRALHQRGIGPQALRQHGIGPPG